MKNKMLMVIFLGLFSAGLYGCSGAFWGGAAAGAVGTGAGYEIQNKRQMDQLNEDYKNGKISKEEYESRKKQIEKGSIIY